MIAFLVLVGILIVLGIYLAFGGVDDLPLT